MKWVLIIAGALALIVAAVWVAGSLLPKEHRAASRISLNQPPDSVWAVVRDLGALKGTWSELTEATRLPDRNGQEVWQEKVGGFDMTLIVGEAVPPRRLVTNIDSPPGAPFGGRWVYELEPSAGGTTVTVAEEGWIGPPPFRLMGQLMGLHRSVDQYLTALGTRFGETVKPEHLAGR